MKMIWDNLKETFITASNSFGLAWWVEIVTHNPRCTYYFGPFLTSPEAEASIPGYVEDLEQEGAQGIVIDVKRVKPNALTIADDLGESIDLQVQPVFSSQM